jgi:hypothetical protein
MTFLAKHEEAQEQEYNLLGLEFLTQHPAKPYTATVSEVSRRRLCMYHNSTPEKAYFHPVFTKKVICLSLGALAAP